MRGDQLMNTLSVIKIPILALAFRDSEAGKLDLAARYTVKPEDRRRGSGLIQTFAPGLNPTYRDIITQMIITSDNTATDIMIDRLGLERVNDLLSERGYRSTRLLATTGDLFRRVWEMQDPSLKSLSHAEVFERGFPNDPGASDRTFAFEGNAKEWLGQTTAKEMSKLLEEIYNAELVPRIFNYYTKSGSPCVSSVRWAKRAIDSRIWSADLVHLNGFGSSLWASR